MTRIIAAAFALFLLVGPAHARGRCDGFNGCRCGVTAARHNGLPLSYNGFNLKQAVEWTRAFARTSFGAGTVGYVRHGGPTGHVFSVVGGSDCSHATVYDEKGTYTRNVCGAVFVSPSRGSVVADGTVRTKHVRHRVARETRVASYAAPDRHAVH